MTSRAPERALLRWGVVTTLVVPMSAAAQPGAAVTSTRAAELFEEGRALFEAQKYSAACEGLSKSDQLGAAAVFLLVPLGGKTTGPAVTAGPGGATVELRGRF